MMSNRQYHVWLVDDDKTYQFTAKMILEATKLTSEIKTFFNGEQAIHFLSDPANHNTDALPDVIFLDINMPIMNGWDFLSAFNKLKSQLPKNIIIYVVSTSVDESDIQKSRTFSTVSDYVIKPINKEKYRQLISVLD